MDKPQKWLIDEVAKETGLFFDSSYLAQILNGSKFSPIIADSINRILEI